MTRNSKKKNVIRLEELLDMEKSALIAGKLDKVGELIGEKENLIEALNALDSLDRIDVTELRSKVERNQALLDGALVGLRRVADRLAALRRIREGIETYDGTGRKQTIQGVVEHKVEKRA